MTVKLLVQPRTKKTGGAKTEQILGVVYGRKFASTPIVVDKKEFEKTFKTAGESTIIELEGLETPVDVLVKEVAFAPTKGGIRHVDFYVIEEGKEMTANIPLHFVGEAPVSKLGAVINRVLHEVEVTCKPKDLPPHFEIDLSSLTAVEDKITVSDIVCPPRVKITNDPEDVVVMSEIMADEPEPEPTEEVAAADVPTDKETIVEKE